jgi:hypothetical protein
MLLAQLNIGLPVAPLTDPELAGFVELGGGTAKRVGRGLRRKHRPLAHDQWYFFRKVT